MDSVTPYSTTVSGYPDFEGSMAESSFRSARRQAVSARETSSIDLSITTREGDIVTLSSDTFSGFDYLSYTSSGRVKNEQGEALSSMSYRSMTLMSGSGFTFSVNGDLNARELDDIEGIVAAIDEIIHEMAAGDMDGAIQKALQMNGYDTVSQFEADLTLTRSYRAVTEVATEARQAGEIPEPSRGVPIKKPGAAFFDKMVELMETKDEPLQKKAVKSLGQLFDHHIHEGKKRWEDREAPDIMPLSDLLKEMKQRLEELFGGGMYKESAV